MSRVVVTGRVPESALERLRAEHDVVATNTPGC